MLSVLEDMRIRFKKKELLIVDLITIVEAVAEASFVEATLQIRPFKPEFVEAQQVLANRTMSTLAETITKAARFK